MAASFLVLISGAAAYPHISGAGITDKVDEDGDGYVSDFTIRVWATLDIDESGNEYKGNAFEAKGDPKFNVMLGTDAGFDRAGLWGHNSASSSGAVSVVRVDFDYGDAQDFVDSHSGTSWIGGTEKILAGEREVNRLFVQYWDSDSCDTCFDSRDEGGFTKTVDLSDDEKLRIEPPSKDREASVSINSNPQGATVYIDGEKKGQTPWNGEMPVDVADRRGSLQVRLEKKGYTDVLKSESIQPPTTLDYSLEKREEPVAVKSTPSGATVRVNGQRIGETPVTSEYWVEKDLDIEVEGNNDTEQFSGINAPWQKNVYLGDSTSLNYGFDPALNYDFQTFDYDLLDLSMVVPQFSRSHRKARVGEMVRLNASGSYSIGYNISSYSWDLGDGSTATGEVVSHSYGSPGNYTVNLTLTDSNGSTYYSAKHVLVENRKPLADFKVPQKIQKGSAVTFRAGPSKDPGGSIVGYEWSIDGSQVATGPALTRAFSSSGEKLVELTVTDSNGATDTASRRITVAEPNVKPVASFTVSDSNPEKGEKITLDASGSNDPDGSIATYSWNLGNGLSKTGQTVQASYQRTGDQDVELTVIDSGGLKANVTKKVRVQSATGGGSSGSQTGASTSGGQSGSAPSGSQGGSSVQGGQSGQQTGAQGSGSNGSSTGQENQSSSETGEESSGDSQIADLLVQLIRAIF